MANKMSETNTWYQDIEKEINSLKKKMAGDESNVKQLTNILGDTKKVDKFSPNCSHCSGFKDEISNVVDGLKEWPDITDKQNENYVSTLNIVRKHLDEHAGRARISGRGGCLIAAICCIVSPILFIVGFIVSIYPQSILEGTPDWTVYWLFTSLSIVLFITGIVFLVIGFRNDYRG